jgi:hypothetical protein
MGRATKKPTQIVTAAQGTGAYQIALFREFLTRLRFTLSGKRWRAVLIVDAAKL